VIYEICNEPNGSDWETQIRPYAEDIIPVIRKNDKNALILVGTNTWSQDVTDVSRHPLEDKNVMYSLHFYAATHKQDLRLKLVKALSDKTPVFISECSICDASGNGTVDRESGQEWMDLIYRYGLSYVEWNLSNKDEASAILKPSCSKTSGYTDADLTETGKWYKDVMSTR
jgi:endoglucanase